ncbi:Protein VACUOLELESS1 [Camellia lanceoleosa]|uniref:Protein VACUOLELESS1 n=1 Tax=Camellia lanceoleosa TaxID=1840588 RepID=A0ACC0IK23_9ERIC|nr:Protein VACUOLELESS1 [Camellia lanceoleosa]
MNFKELQEFKNAGDVGDTPALTPSDRGVKKDGHGLGWRAVPTHDPVVQDAAHHAVKTIHTNPRPPFKITTTKNVSNVSRPWGGLLSHREVGGKPTKAESKLKKVANTKQTEQVGVVVGFGGEMKFDSGRGAAYTLSLLILSISHLLHREVVIMHWACAKIIASLAILDITLLEILLDKLKICRSLSYAAVAAHADKSGRRKLAAMLVEHEPRSSNHFVRDFDRCL